LIYYLDKEKILLNKQMDIIPNKKSNLLYQKGDEKTKGVVDLRHFAEKKRKIKIENKNKIVLEIIKKENFKERTKCKSATMLHSSEALGTMKSANRITKPAKISLSPKKCFSPPLIKRNQISPSLMREDHSCTSSLINASSLIRKKYSYAPPLIRGGWGGLKSFACFILASFFVSSIIFAMSFLQGEFEQKEKVMGAGTEAYDYLKIAGLSASDYDFENSSNSFNSATLNFAASKKMIDEFGLGIAGIINNLPINTPISTAENLAAAGENISTAGESATELMGKISRLNKDSFSLNSSRSPRCNLSTENCSELRVFSSQSSAERLRRDKEREKFSFSLNSILEFQSNIDNIALNLRDAQKNLDNVNIDYIPENLKGKLETAKNQLPAIADNFENLSRDFPIMAKMLGSNRPQKYLLIFENNSEIRAGGGFIGSYGILDIEDGKIKNLFIDGIFNPDGQLNEKIVPPIPIQKISAAWSMHDANWFADFPTSAKKVALFYEKTGGPTVDGVIAITPSVIEKMLKITGPIEMEKYSIVISAENFLMETQLQVEELYDAEENKPKKFLADLAPKIINKLFNTENLSAQEKIERYFEIVSLAEKSFREKHIIFYHRDGEIESMIIKRGWGGQVLNSSGDYLSVVNSNINGYKTDAVIDERIIHNAEILSDGSIIDTVRVIRKHTGGRSDYDWYNRVNSNYMRVYAPIGSVLLEAKGHTWQDYEPPIDYSDFKTDPDVAEIESSLKIDPETGTHIFEEAGKTVFGNWVYVSPGETVEVMYKYRLPYKIDFDGFTKPADKYSILIQKQLGSIGSKFSGSIKLPDGWNTVWNSPGLNFESQNESAIETDLKVDRIYGTVFSREMNELN